jgi:hypothetical protein
LKKKCALGESISRHIIHEDWTQGRNKTHDLNFQIALNMEAMTWQCELGDLAMWTW